MACSSFLCRASSAMVAGDTQDPQNLQGHPNSTNCCFFFLQFGNSSSAIAFLYEVDFNKTCASCTFPSHPMFTSKKACIIILCSRSSDPLIPLFSDSPFSVLCFLIHCCAFGYCMVIQVKSLKNLSLSLSTMHIVLYYKFNCSFTRDIGGSGRSSGIFFSSAGSDVHKYNVECNQ